MQVSLFSVMMKACKVRDLSAASSSRLCAGILLVAVTLLLPKELTAEPNNAQQARRCHWCGPRAEQIHRSRRAPECDPASLQTQVTDCDSGYDYCAIVATTPPYTESRHCVKLYQDECYPLYCNTTGTWRITCPCRGDLCNAANTEREINAFSALSKLSIKNTTPSNRRKITKSHTNIVKRDVDDAMNDLSTTPSSQIENTATDIIVNTTEQTINKKTCSTAEETTISINIPNELKKDEDIKPEVDDASNEIDCEYGKDIQKAEAVTISEGLNELHSEEQKPVDTPSTVQINTSPLPQNEDNNSENKIDENPATIPAVITETKITEPLQVENQISEVEASIVNHGSSEAIKDITKMEVKPSVSLPPAEALQHNVTPITNVDKTETTIPQITSTQTTILQHETTMLPHKNGVAIFLNNKYLIIIISLLFSSKIATNNIF